MYLDAFATNYNRYLGAKGSRDAQAMMRLAGIMLMLAERALAAGQDAAQRQSEFQRQVEQRLNGMRTAVEAKGVTWPTALKQAGVEIKSRGLPHEIQRELTEAKVAPEEITAFQKQLEATTPELIDSDIAALKNPAPTEPPYISDLQNAQQLAANSWNEAKAAASASQPAAAAATPPAGAVTKSSAASGHSVLFCSFFGSLGALVVLAFVMGFRSVRRRAKV